MLTTTPQKPKIPSIGIFLLCILVAGAFIYFYTWPQYSQYKTDKSQVSSNQDSISKLQSEQNEGNQSIKTMDGSQTLQNLDLAIPDSSNTPDLYAYLETIAKASNLSLSTVQALDESTLQKNQAGGAGAGTASAGSAGAGLDSAGAGSGAGIASADSGSAGGTAMPGSTSPAATTTSKLPSDLGKVDITMTVRGQVANFNQFLEALEKSLRFLDVQSITVSSSDESSNTTSTSAASASTAPNPLTFNVRIVTYYLKQK